MIGELKAQLKDESKGADRLNDYLYNVFDRQSLSLKAIEENPGDASSGCRFEVTRNDKIDDPISSLDANHIFLSKALSTQRL